MNIHQIRRKNLQHLADSKFPGHGQQRKLAEFMGWSSPIRASQLLNEKGIKNIGETIARLVEQKFSLPRDWLDHTHPDLWNGVAESVSAYNITTEFMNSAGIHIKALPLLQDDEAAQWISGKRFTPTSKLQFPTMPMMTVSENAFVLEETTSSMPPQQPGDFYYIDPLIAPESGDWAAFIIDGRVVVGKYEKGRMRDRLEFTDGKEAAIEVTEYQHAGKVLTRVNGDFARGVSG